MFSLEEMDDFWSQISSTPNQLYTQQEDLILDHSRLQGSDLYTNKTEKKRKKSPDLRDDRVKVDKKMMRRDTERQRRKEMATLFTSLRSLLPIEYVKGKRSVSDHMGGAVSYIKHLEKKIKEMSVKKEKLKSLSNSSAFGPENETLHMYSMKYCVMVSPCLGGLRIMLSSSYAEEEFKLSKVLEVLLKEGLSVMSCVSTKVNQRLLHTVQIEVSDQTCLNLSDLQQKLYKVVILRAI